MTALNNTAAAIRNIVCLCIAIPTTKKYLCVFWFTDQTVLVLEVRLDSPFREGGGFHLGIIIRMV